MKHDYISVIKNTPYKIGNLIGFPLLTDLHNEWLKTILFSDRDETLLAHRNSYKTTTVSVGLALLIAFHPDSTTLFLRKTDTDTKEIIAQVSKILKNPSFVALVEAVTGKRFEVVKDSATEIDTTYNIGARGTSQLLGMGIGGSLTGKHYDYIFTDDIVNLSDRISRAEREKTKGIYQELQNIKTSRGRIINTGTPWHVEDCISTLMPNVQRWDCYTTGLMTADQIEIKKQSMSPSLFAANYELRHIATENALFTGYPAFMGNKAMLRDGIAHVDAAYGGEDYTALTIGKRIGDTLYIYGRLWQKHVDTVLDAITAECAETMCNPIYCETNGDKGYLGRELRRSGQAVRMYAEKQNKYLKISTFARKWWKNIKFVEGTDKAYIDQITQYTEDAEHDDAPDSLACVCRILDRGSAEIEYVG